MNGLGFSVPLAAVAVVVVVAGVVGLVRDLWRGDEEVGS